MSDTAVEPDLSGVGLPPIGPPTVEVPPVGMPAADVPTASIPGTAARLGAGSPPLDLLADVELAVSAELGRTRMQVRDLLALGPGSVVELDRAAGSPIDVLVNGTLIARGEVVVVDEEFGVRLTEIVGYGGDDRR